MCTDRKEEGGRSEYKSVGEYNFRLKESLLPASAVQGNNPMIYVSIENIFIFSLKFWEEGPLETRMLNRNNMLLLIKYEVWERGGYI